MEREQMLKRLRDFLMLSETAPAEDILAALSAVISEVEDGAMSADDMKMYQEALEVEDPDAIASALKEMQVSVEDMMKEDDETVDASAGYEARKGALRDVRAAASAHAAVPRKSATVPYQIPDAPRSAKSGTRRGAPALVGRASKPGLHQMVKDLKARKSQSYQTGPTGGFMLNHEISSDIIPALRAAVPLFDMGVREYDMTGIETLTVPKVTAEATAYWVGEATQVTESQETYGTITLVAKPLAARIVVPNKMLQNALPTYEQQLRDDMTYQISRAIMTAALQGTGSVSGSGNTGAQPLGLLNISDVTQTPLNGRPTIEDMTDAIGRIEDENIEMSDTWGWLFAPRTKRTFTSMTDQNGLPILRADWRSGEEQGLLGLDYYTSTIIPINVTGGTPSATNNTNIYLGDWRYMILAMSNNIEIMVLDQLRGDYLQTVLVAFTYVDIAVTYPQAFDVQTFVRP